jgi:hypothetical protein
MWYGLSVNFRNACSYPVQVTAQPHTIGRDTGRMDKYLEPGETIRILSIATTVNDIQLNTPDTYRLEIGSNGNQRSLNRVQFLEELKQAEYAHKWRSSNYQWTINDPTLCPGTVTDHE